MTLDNALRIATKVHTGQKDKAGVPYILHPIRIMNSMPDIEEKIIAILHDVVEDSDWTIKRLEVEGFSTRIMDAIDAITWRQGEDYKSYILRVGENELARKVKIEDLKDNLNLTRLVKITNEDAWRTAKYHRSLKILET